MRLEDIHEYGPRLEDDEIPAFERQIGTQLPEDYRYFLHTTNGGIVAEHSGYFYLREADWWNHVNCFYGLRRPSAPTNELSGVMQRLAKNYPDRFGARYGKLPIGADYYGNVIYLYLSGPEKNSVYFWMHNADTDDDKVSPSFSAFLNSLRDEPPPKDRQNPANDLPS